MKKIFSFGLVAAMLIGSSALARADESNQIVIPGVDTKKFTHMEWTGKDYIDMREIAMTGEDVFGINREDAAVTVIPYQDMDAAAAAVWDYNARENSTYMQLLTGENENWELTVVRNQTEAQRFLDGGFMNSSYNTDAKDDWKTVQLPKSWTMLGFDYPIYTNVTMPWQGESVNVPEAPTNYNPVGLYRKTFTLTSEMMSDDRRIYLQFDGVESAYYVYINGKEVGYSEDSFSPHSFDITDYLISGENLLAVKVHKFCDGTWFEDQDMIYDGGIFRDVFLTSRPLVQISDYTVRTDLDADFKNAELDLSIDIRNLSGAVQSGWQVKATVLDERGASIMNANLDTTAIENGKTDTFNLRQTVAEPRLWSAENPNLYALVLTLTDESGTPVETVSTQLGFREINFTSTQVDSNYRVTTTRWDPITINGERLIFKGVNRHDTDPFYGKTATQQSMDEDIRLMKLNNINSIRTSHYSNDSYLYWLCNKYGIYMMAETNMESHALMYDNQSKGLFYELAMDRTETAYERLKNNPSIVAWSIGNEMVYTSDPNNSGGMFRDMVWYFKNNDPTRPVHSESLGSSVGVDMGSNMYPNSDSIWGNAGKGKIPYVMCEYEHAMGNSVGAMKEYWDAIRSADNMLGGFVWDWADQARALSLDTVNLYNITDMTGVGGKSYGSGDGWTDADAGSLNGGKAFEGYTVMDDNPKFNAALSGSGKSFTFEVIAKPASTANNNVFLAKGDRQVALKTKSTGSGLEFFVYSGGNWKSVECNFPQNWLNAWHQIVGVYNKGALSIYIDGNLMASQTVEDKIDAGNWPVGIGYDADAGRTFNGQISIARIYSKALTKAEIDGQRSTAPAITVNDSSVLLWLDYADALTSGSGVWDYYAQVGAHSNLYAEESKGMYFGCGGDFGDNPNDNSFCQNGLVSPDREPQPELAEIKFQYQDFWFSADPNQLGRKTVSVYNENSFRNLNEYDVAWQLLKNGMVIDEGMLPVADIAPHTTGYLTIPYELPAVNAGDEFYLNLSVHTREETEMIPAGTEIAYGQLQIPVNAGQLDIPVSGKNVNVSENDDEYIIQGEDFGFSIDKATGTMKNYVYNGETLVSDGPRPNFWRGYVENDFSSADAGLFDTNWKSAAENIVVDHIDISENQYLQKTITVDITLPNAQNTKETIVYTINGDGQVTVNMSVDATANRMGNFLRVGSLLTLPEGFETVSWYGNGPVETFNDRNTNARQGIWTSTATDFFFPFMRVDDCGNLTEVKWISIKNDYLNNGLLVAATNPIEASALHFKPDDFNAVSHVYELTPRDETILSLDYGSMGTGTARCGQGTLPQYRLPSDRVYEWEYTLIPVDGNYSDEALSEAARPYCRVTSYIQDKSKNAMNIPIADTAVIKTSDGEQVMSGSLEIPFNSILSPVLEGKNSFTVEAVVTPTGDPEFNMFLGKGDNAFALRTRPGILDFHIYAGGSWRSISYNMPDDMKSGWIGQKHQIAGIYDAANNVIRLYADGKMLEETATGTNEGVAHSEYNLTIGACPDTGRTSQADFSEIRVYNRALTASELATQITSTPALPHYDETVELWLDFESTEEPEREKTHITITASEDVVYADYTIVNEKGELYAYFAKYDADNKLVEVKASVVTADSLRLTIPVTDGEYNYKAFLWNGQQKPICDLAEYE